jgi:Laminin G domain
VHALSSAESTIPKAAAAAAPSFGGKSFIALRNWDQQRGSGSQELTIDIEFRPSTTSGILLYGGQQEDGRGDFVSLAINDGRVEFR